MSGPIPLLPHMLLWHYDNFCMYVVKNAYKFVPCIVTLLYVLSVWYSCKFGIAHSTTSQFHISFQLQAVNKSCELVV